MKDTAVNPDKPCTFANANMKTHCHVNNLINQQKYKKKLSEPKQNHAVSSYQPEKGISRSSDGPRPRIMDSIPESRTLDLIAAPTSR